MKILKSFLVCFILITFFSCSGPTWDTSTPTNKESTTTVEILKSVIDTCATVALTENGVYIIEDNLVTKKLSFSDKTSVCMSAGGFFIFFICITFLSMLAGYVIGIWSV